MAGVLPGDVITAYAGKPTPDHDALASAKRVADQTRGAAVTVEVTRPDGSAAALPIGTGKLGVNVLPVSKGVAATLLPPATDVVFEVDRLRQTPLDEWFGFRFPPAPKIGFEHADLRVVGDRVVLRREVAFDGGRQWELNHYDVTVEADAANPLRVRKVTYAAPLENFESVGMPAVAEDGARIWRTQWTGREEESGEVISGTRQAVLPTDLPVVPAYFVYALASLMPKKPGNCVHFRPLAEGEGRPMLKSALLVVRREPVAEGDATRSAWRIEQRRAGGQVVGVYWVDDAGRTLRSEYGGPVAYRTTKEEAVAGIHPDIKVRSGN